MNGIYPERRKRTDNLPAGLAAGLLLPFVILMIIYKVRFPEASFDEFLQIAVKEKMLAPLLSLCIVPNLGLFFLFLHLEKLKTARGIILATLIYGIPIVIYKFFS